MNKVKYDIDHPGSIVLDKIQVVIKVSMDVQVVLKPGCDRKKF